MHLNKFASAAFLLIFCLLLSCRAKSSSGSGVGSKDSTVIFEQEMFRPQIHFTPQSHWMNDPNGMVYYKGEYHLFYQYYPDSTIWGPMHWGHAVSQDLIHWKHLPIALFPDSLGYIFSGSAVVDAENTSSLGSKDNPPMVAMFTYHNAILEKSGSDKFQNQGIAFSIDKGRSWKKYKKNPVLLNPGIRDFRDPKVGWCESIHKWIVVLAAGDRVKFYSSANLINWQFESDFGMGNGAHGGVWECPDLFPLRVENQNDLKWVLIVNINPGGPNGGSAAQYFTGDFDGHSFKPSDYETRWVDWGKDNYAGVTWSNIPETDGRRILIGWMSNWQYASTVPTSSWRGAATIPRQLSLLYENKAYKLLSNPVTELQRLRDSLVEIKSNKTSGILDISSRLPFDKAPMEVVIKFNQLISANARLTGKFGIKISNEMDEETLIGYDLAQKQFYIDRSKSGLTKFSNDFPGIFTSPGEIIDNSIEMHMIFDVASVELFAQDGRSVMTDIFFPGKAYNQISIFSDGREVDFTECKIWKLNPAW